MPGRVGQRKGVRGLTFPQRDSYVAFPGSLGGRLWKVAASTETCLFITCGVENSICAKLGDVQKDWTDYTIFFRRSFTGCGLARHQKVNVQCLWKNISFFFWKTKILLFWKKKRKFPSSGRRRSSSAGRRRSFSSGRRKSSSSGRRRRRCDH